MRIFRRLRFLAAVKSIPQWWVMHSHNKQDWGATFRAACVRGYRWRRGSLCGAVGQNFFEFLAHN